MKKYKNRKTVEKTISKIIDEIKKDFKKGTDKNTEFLIKKAENEYKRVCRLLTI